MITYTSADGISYSPEALVAAAEAMPANTFVRERLLLFAMEALELLRRWESLPPVTAVVDYRSREVRAALAQIAEAGPVYDALAARHGWGLFDNGVELEIEKLDYPEEWREEFGADWTYPVFASDREAVDYVQRQALGTGDHAKLCQLALLVHKCPNSAREQGERQPG